MFGLPQYVQFVRQTSKSSGMSHTICEQCVDQLTKGVTINCPTCRQQFPSSQIGVNFLGTDILQAMCESCFKVPHGMKCPHCSKNLCEKCLERHSESVHDELVLDLKKLDGMIQEATDFVKDGSFVKQQKKKETDTVNEIKQAIQSHKDEVDRLEKRLKKEVELTKEKNLTSFRQQSKTLIEKMDTMKGFPAENLRKFNTNSNKTKAIQEMLSVHHECKRLTEDLTVGLTCGSYDNYSFAKSAFNLASVGTLVIKGISKLSAGGPVVPDYTTLRYFGQTGSLGSDRQHFNKPGYILCTSDKIIVSDELNHCLKIYDNDLNLQRVVGVKGSGRGQFCNPLGLAEGPGGELYVADFNNHRVVVMTSQGEYLREICKKGSGNDEIQGPLGIAISDDYLFIADSRNYRIKVVKTDGTFNNHIGSEGDGAGHFQNVPTRVALMSHGDGRVLVKEVKKQQLRVFTRAGEYQGLFPPTIPTELARDEPCAMTVDRSDNVLVTYNTCQLAVYNSRGDLNTVLGSRGQGPGQFDLPNGVNVNTQRRHVVVCDKDNHRIQMFKFHSK